MNFAATKYAAEFIPPLLLVAIRFTVGGLLMLCLLRLLEPGTKLLPKDLLPMAGLGCVGVAISQTGFTFSVSMSSAANTGLIFATSSVWGMLLGFVLGLERPKERGILGVGLCIIEVSIVFYDGLGAENNGSVDDFLVLAAGAGFEAYTILSMLVLGCHSPLAVSTYSLLFGGISVLLLSTPYSPELKWKSVGSEAWAAVAFSAYSQPPLPFRLGRRASSVLGLIGY